MEKPTPKHYIVWRERYSNGRYSTSHCKGEEWDALGKNLNEDQLYGGACVLEATLNADQAEEIALLDSFWQPIEPETIKHNQATLNQEKAMLRGHYPEAW